MRPLGTCRSWAIPHVESSPCKAWEHVKDPADDGPEVFLIRFFKYFPEGSRYAPFNDFLKTRAPLAS